jgi:cysteine desulfuration protein SufE
VIQQRVEKLIGQFQSMSNWEEKYQHIIKMGKNLTPIDENFRKDQYLVKGCQSKVWLHAKLKDGVVFFEADSDATIVRGIIALLLSVYSAATPDEILSTKPTFLENIGLSEHLSMARSNGLASMLKQISLYAIAFKAQR